jgi:hypothetical protein
MRQSLFQNQKAKNLSPKTLKSKKKSRKRLKVLSNLQRTIINVILEEAGDAADDYEFPGEAKPEEDAAEDEPEE